MTISFIIPVAPVTKKNSQRIIWNKRVNRPMVLPSEKYKQYEKDAMFYLPTLEKPISTPVNVKAVFYVSTRHPVDLSNLISALHDVLTAGGVIADDNRNIVYAVDGSRVLWDKQNPRTEVEITDIPEDEFQSWEVK